MVVVMEVAVEAVVADMVSWDHYDVSLLSREILLGGGGYGGGGY